MAENRKLSDLPLTDDVQASDQIYVIRPDADPAGRKASIDQLPVGAVAQAILDGKQPLNPNLSSIAALSTVAYGRGVLTAADAAALRTMAGLGSIATVDASANGASLVGATNYAAMRVLLAFSASDISDFSTAADARITAQKNQNNGLAPLDSAGMVPAANLPALALSKPFSVASQTAQLALTAQEGDLAVRTDLSKTYMHNNGTAGTMADWTELLSPTGGVTSFNTRTGAVTLTSSDVTTAASITSNGLSLIQAANYAAMKVLLNLSNIALTGGLINVATDTWQTLITHASGDGQGVYLLHATTGAVAGHGFAIVSVYLGNVSVLAQWTSGAPITFQSSSLNIQVKFVSATTPQNIVWRACRI